jgi:hypothetical protein
MREQTAGEYFTTPIARFATRPGGGGLDKFKPGSAGYETLPDETPDLIMGTLMKGGAHLLKSDWIYEMVQNEMTGVIELREVGRSTIGKSWTRNFYDIPLYDGNRVWLSQNERNGLEERESQEA